MADSLFSPSWYRVAGLRPRLRRHLQIRRHQYREETWYILQDYAAQKAHRLNPNAYYLVGLMDGNRTIQEIWDLALDKLGDDVPTQEEVIRLFGELHSADVLQCDIPPEAAELQQRFEKTRRRELIQRFMNPMALRFPLVDPERFLTRGLPFVKWLFTPLGLLLWAVVVGAAVVQAGAHWEELTRNVTDRVLAPGNLLLMFFVFPIVKALHELGHGFAVKRWGGEVHDMGIMLLVLMPVPYVDATASWEFRDKSKRMVVGAAGVLVELFIAAIAMFLWIMLEPGIARSVMYNVMLIAGVSTILFNGNPLLRFDGYYILADWLEIPNLATRSKKYLAYLCQKYLLGTREPPPVHTQLGERGWLVFYAIASFFYRLFIATVIIIFVAGRFFTIGILLAIWVSFVMIVLPLGKVTRFVLFNPVLRKNRNRSIMVSGAAAAGLLALLFIVPMPFLTRAEGVIWLPEQAHVRAGTAGFVERIEAPVSGQVKAGDVLLTLRDPELLAERERVAARRDELEVRYRAERSSSFVDARITADEIAAVDQQLARLEGRVEKLTLRAGADGMFVVSSPDDLPGRFLNQGDNVGYVIGQAKPKVRAVITQQNVDLIRNRTGAVSLRLASRVPDEFPVEFLREVPAATNELPSAALSQQGGGEIANDPSAGRDDIAFQAVFQFEFLLPDSMDIGRYGERVYVRFDHGFAPLWSQWYRKLKILFLRLLDD